MVNDKEILVRKRGAEPEWIAGRMVKGRGGTRRFLDSGGKRIDARRVIDWRKMEAK